MRRPDGVLLDYGGTLVEEIGDDPRAGTEAVLAHAVQPVPATIDAIVARAERVAREVAERRDRFGIETPWPALTRLVHDYFGTRFRVPLDELELAFWDASVRTRPMPGAREALQALHDAGVALGVVSNSSFGARVIRHELATHGLAVHLAVVVVSAEYAVRKPNPLLFEVAAARLGVSSADMWFVGDRLDTDVAGARAAGMTPIWYRPTAASAAPDGCITVSSWGELARLFREAEA
jgi:putative hydrolase of the HAD superfamily